MNMRIQISFSSSCFQFFEYILRSENCFHIVMQYFQILGGTSIVFSRRQLHHFITTSSTQECQIPPLYQHLLLSDRFLIFWFIFILITLLSVKLLSLMSVIWYFSEKVSVDLFSFNMPQLMFPFI